MEQTYKAGWYEIARIRTARDKLIEVYLFEDTDACEELVRKYPEPKKRAYYTSEHHAPTYVYDRN